jgi:hypothetical protein
MSHDHTVLRDLASRYAAIAADPVMAQRRELWADHLSLKPTRPLLTLCSGIWDQWVAQALAPANLSCQDPELRQVERDLRYLIMLHSYGSDDIAEPWISVPFVRKHTLWGHAWQSHDHGDEGAYKLSEPIATWADMAKLVPPVHEVDEAASRRRWDKVEEALGGTLVLDRQRIPECVTFAGDIATDLGRLHGIERSMIEMAEDPEGLTKLIEVLRDGILENLRQAEAAGDFCLTSGLNQTMTYSRELPWPKANTPATPGQIWGHCAAQEFTGVSPRQHQRFLLANQLPIVSRYGLLAYGCCEDMTHKITMLRQVPNLRMIAVAPTANLAKCCAQIGTDYVVSWRPNPSDTVCGPRWDAERVRTLLRAGLESARGTRLHIMLKDVYTLHGDEDRLRRYHDIAREEIARAGWSC